MFLDELINFFKMCHRDDLTLIHVHDDKFACVYEHEKEPKGRERER